MRRIRATATVAKGTTLVTALAFGATLSGFVASPGFAASKSAPVMTVLTPSSVSAGSSNNLLSFKVQAKQSFTNGSITVTVPAGGWTVPNSATGVVSTQKGTCANAPAVIATATTFGASGVSCGTNKYFVVIYKTTAPNAAGPYSFPYSFTSSAGSQAGTLTETVGAAAASHLTFVNPAVDNAVAGSSLTTDAGANPIKVRVEDAFNNLVNSTMSIAIAPNKNTGGFAGTTPKNAVAGIATFSNLSESVADTGYTLTASHGGVTSATSNSFNVTHAAPSSLTLALTHGTVCPEASDAQSICANGSDTENAVATVTDTYGNPVSGRTVNLSTDGDTTPSTPLTDNLDGTYSGTITASSTADQENITATDSLNALVTDTKVLTEVVEFTLTPTQAPQGAWYDPNYPATLNYDYCVNGGCILFDYFDTAGANNTGAASAGNDFNTCACATSITGALDYMWDATVDRTLKPQVFQDPGGDTSTGNAATIYSPTSFTVTITLASPFAGNLRLYALDYDSHARHETITVDDGSGPQAADLTSFDGGAWVTVPLNAAIGDQVTITVTNVAGPNAVLSGLFLEG